MTEQEQFDPLDPKNEVAVVRTLQYSLYPGANDGSVRMVLDYCRAARLDPLLKPVHIVPMSVKIAKDKYEWRDTIMPGIALWRIQASRSGLHCGTDEPVFGQTEILKVGEYTLEHPDSCKVTVYKMVGGKRCPFTAIEFWIENYATAGRDSQVPNAMWKRRTRGQIAKCAEAQALRKAFPELFGGNYTAEEMEGQVIEGDAEAAPREEIKMPAAVEHQPEEKLPAMKVEKQADPVEQPISGPAEEKPAKKAAPVKEPSTGKAATEPMLKLVRRACELSGVAETAVCAAFGLADLKDLRSADINDALKVAKGVKE